VEIARGPKAGVYGVDSVESPGEEKQSKVELLQLGE